MKTPSDTVGAFRRLFADCLAADQKRLEQIAPGTWDQCKDGCAALYDDALVILSEILAGRKPKYKLTGSVHAWMRGLVVQALYRAKVAPELFRDELSFTWEMNHRSVIDLFPKRSQLQKLFAYAAFPLPGDLPETVEIYRGTSFLPFKKAVRGFSWTVNPDVAAFFAIRFSEKNGNPLVIKATVGLGDISLYTDGRNEAEAVVFGGIVDPKPWGNADAWMKGVERYRNQKGEAK